MNVYDRSYEPDQTGFVIKRAIQRQGVENEVRQLQQERVRDLADPDTVKSRIRTIINSLPNGVLVTNHQGVAALINPAFIRQMDLPGETVTGWPVKKYIADENLCRLVMEISQGRHLDFEDIAPHEFSVGAGKFLQARGRPVLDEKHVCLGAVITLEDVTARKAMDRLKNEFVAKVSHELRSPLSTIHEQLAVVLNAIGDQVSFPDARLLSRAKEKTRGLISLIGDLLDLSRIESGDPCEALRPVVLTDLLDHIVDFLNSRAAAKHQQLILIRPRDPLPPVKADPLALESIFGNLITNAINYTPENGKIEVRIARTDINIQVQVIDNGFGIEARHLSGIFERFYRVRTEKTRCIIGTGLGLTIVKGLVDSLGGRIAVESAPDRGSTFSVVLPPMV